MPREKGFYMKGIVCRSCLILKTRALTLYLPTRRSTLKRIMVALSTTILHPRSIFPGVVNGSISAHEFLIKADLFFIYNIPKWNVILGNYLLEEGLDFRHWIAVNIKLSLPVPGRLYPSRYNSLLYYTKGKPKTYHKIRTPIERCRHCGGEIKDYCGHRKVMNLNGVNLTDVCDDIYPVRHKKISSCKRMVKQRL